jgi:hypothetical protein
MGDELPLKFHKFSDLTLGDKAFHYRFGVCEIPTKADDLLGTDFLAEHEARLDLTNRKQEVRQSSRNRYCFTRSGDVAFKIFPARVSQAGWNAQLEGGGNVTSEEISHFRNLISLQGDPWLIQTTKAVRLAPLTKQLVTGKLDLKTHRETASVCVCDWHSYPSREL